LAAADEAAADAARINSAHAEIVNQHRKLFLAKAFRINPSPSLVGTISGAGAPTVTAHIILLASTILPALPLLAAASL
jgi:hypothetical protein